MMTVKVAQRFKRSFKKVPMTVQENFQTTIDLFLATPTHPSLKLHKLHGRLDVYHAFSLRDGYRVLVEFEDAHTVLLINIGNHDDYAKWARE